MLHAEFQDHRTSGSGEEDFLRFVPYMGGHVTWTIYIKTSPPLPRILHFDWSSGFRGEDV